MSQIVLTSTVIAAALTSVLNLIIAFVNRSSTRAVERLKHAASFQTQRFNDLKQARSVLNAATTLDFDQSKLIHASRNGDRSILPEYYSAVDDTYRSAREYFETNRPLISKGRRAPLNNEIEQIAQIVREVQMNALKADPEDASNGMAAWAKLEPTYAMKEEFIEGLKTSINDEMVDITDSLTG